MSKISRWYGTVCKLVARCCGIPCATRISRRYEVVYKSYISNLQKASIIMALSSILLVMILDTLWAHKPFDGCKIYFLYTSVILLFVSSVVGIESIIRDCINYNSEVLSRIDGMYSTDDADDTFLREVMHLNNNVKFCIKTMSVLTAVSLLLVTVATLV